MAFTFGDHVLDLDRRELRRGGAAVAVEPQVFDVLAYLIRERGRVVSRDDLIDAVWGGRIVSEFALASRINSARQAIGDSGAAQALIRTVPRRGFRFVGEVREDVPIASAAGAPALPDKPSIAVLPFVNMSNDPEQDYFADGMVEDLITNLSRLRWLFVIARNSSFTYKRRAIDVRQIGQELGVRYVLEGSVRRSGDRLRITAQLIEAESGGHVWADRYDRPIEDIFAVQDEITDTISATLEPEISAAERARARTKPPGNLGAWEYYQRGMWLLFRQGRDDFPAARALFRDALNLDPTFATAHAGIAAAIFWEWANGHVTDPDPARAELVAAATRAVECDPRDSLAHSVMGLAYMETGRMSDSLAEHETAVTLNPNSAYGQWCYGYALNRADQFAEALARFDLAARLSPRDPMAWAFQTLRASALYLAGRYEEAIVAGRHGARLQTGDGVWPLVHWAAALGQLDRQDEAAPVVADICRKRPGFSIAALKAWPHNRGRSAHSLEDMADGLRKAGVPE